MRRPWVNALFFAVAATALVVLQAWGPDGLYTFGGHGQTINDLVRLCLWLLVFTHAFLATVMWTQRRRWDDAEASTFRFIIVKGLLWFWFAWTAHPRNGVSLPYVLLVIVILATTIDLDVQLVRRYVLARKDRS
jgi:hypothetical protein